MSEYLITPEDKEAVLGKLTSTLNSKMQRVLSGEVTKAIDAKSGKIQFEKLTPDVDQLITALCLFHQVTHDHSVQTQDLGPTKNETSLPEIVMMYSLNQLKEHLPEPLCTKLVMDVFDTIRTEGKFNFQKMPPETKRLLEAFGRFASRVYPRGFMYDPKS